MFYLLNLLFDQCSKHSATYSRTPHCAFQHRALFESFPYLILLSRLLSNSPFNFRNIADVGSMETIFIIGFFGICQGDGYGYKTDN